MLKILHYPRIKPLTMDYKSTYWNNQVGCEIQFLFAEPADVFKSLVQNVTSPIIWSLWSSSTRMYVLPGKFNHFSNSYLSREMQLFF